MSNLLLDFPVSSDPADFTNNVKSILVVDPFVTVYSPRAEHDGKVYVSKCLVRKPHYDMAVLIDSETDSLIPSPHHADAYLVKETNFQDIGGGIMSFERHYATFPSEWYEFEEVSYQTSHYGIINYRDKAGEGADWSKSRNVLARAGHFYFRKKDIPTTRYPDSATAGTTGVFDYTADNFGRITKFHSYFNIAPQATLGKNWEDHTPDEDNHLSITVIAPDRIIPYMGNIYEFIRYTIEF